ncbi:MAG: UPF0182 family protein [Actinomycetota bacterium]|nr:UPF0182 family protein [Actinomycetota bacterium]
MTKRLPLLIPIIFIGISLLGTASGIYTDFLWFSELGYKSVFFKALATKSSVFLISFLVAYLFLYLNLSIAQRFAPKYQVEGDNQIVIINPPLKRLSGPITIFTAALFSFFMAIIAQEFWLDILRYNNATPFGKIDPIFQKDIAFYVFSLPLYQLVHGWLTALIMAGLIATILSYFLSRGLVIGKKNFYKLSFEAKGHLLVLAGLFFLALSLGYLLQSYGLLYSGRGVAFGVAYTDIYAELPMLRLKMLASSLVAVFIFLNIWRAGFRPLLVGLAVLLFTIVIGGIYPALIQRLVVSPNEMAREEGYIAYNIENTRAAYGIDKVVETEMSAEDGLSADDLIANEATIRNIRLWDWRPLKTTFKQIQEIRPYYVFNDVDIDRYKFNASFEQVALSARELSIDNLPSSAKTWVNEHLVYTHGYGFCLNPVNKVTSDGLPDFYVKDIPPKSNVNLSIERPEIYYGEINNAYSIIKVNEPTRELDYPKGDVNEYTVYEGGGGIELSFLRKIAFSIRFGTIKPLISSAIREDSRIIFDRTIESRASNLAPFLSFDGDPYLVVEGGRLYWMLDGYTTTSMYPYSTPTDGFNYIRNSVKVVMDAYDGDITFFVFDETDPLINSYRKIFPDLFKDASEMKEGLKAHIRYPVDLMKVQARIYSTYHMADPQVFYSKEDTWALPGEIYGDEEIEMEPYYIIMKLMGEESEEFLLMLPFTPSGKNNMIGWMAVRCDGDNYGQMIVYKFPKDKLIFGPMQIEARVNQDPTISRELTLWGQRGSSVIRGNLLVIPIEKSVLYVEPLYLKAEQSELPELKRVIVGYGNRVVMEETLEAALTRVFGTGDGGEPPPEAPIPTAGETTIEELIKRANEHFSRAEAYQKDGNWGAYGEEIARLKEVLAELDGRINP